MKRKYYLSVIMLFCAVFFLSNGKNKCMAESTKGLQEKQQIKKTGQKETKKEFAQKITTKAKLKTMNVREVKEISFVVKNTSNQTWKATDPQAPVHLSYHWLDSAGKSVMEGGRAKLPHDLAPGKAVILKAAIQAPDTSGTYTLTFSMVKETVAWFDGQGAMPLKLTIIVK